MSDGMDLNRTWWGYGVKYGGILGFAGAETIEGFIYNAKSMSWHEKFTLTNVRLGVGLGGGVGAVAMLAFNTPSLSAVDGIEVTGWGISISLGPNVSPMLNAIAKASLTPGDLEDISNGLNQMYSLLEIASMEDAPQIVSFDLGGISREVSLNYAFGKFEVDWGVAE